MSLLEDVFLEDEAGEAQELERVIEGDEYDERPLSPNSDDNEEKGDEAEEDKKRVDPSDGKAKRIVKNPRFVLNPARLSGPRGIQIIPEHFKDFKFRGKGHEKEDLDMVLKKLEHWAYRLYPKFKFEDCLKKIETLGKKRPVMVHLHKIRSDQITSEETVAQNDSSDDEPPPPPEEDEFDKLLQQQIERTSATPMSVAKTPHNVPSVDRSLLMPKATSSPSINDEQRERMLSNRRLAEERRLAKLSNNSAVDNVTKDADKNSQTYTEIDGIAKLQDDVVVRKHNRSNVIDSSSDDDEEMGNNNQSETIIVEHQNKNAENSVGIDSNIQRNNFEDSSSDDDEMTINQSITVEVHKNDANLENIDCASDYVRTNNKDHGDIDEISEVTNTVEENLLIENIKNKSSNIKDADIEQIEIIDNNNDKNDNANGVITKEIDAENNINDVIPNECNISKDNYDLLLDNDKNNVKPVINVLKESSSEMLHSETNNHINLNDHTVSVGQDNVTGVVDVMDVDFDDDF